MSKIAYVISLLKILSLTACCLMSSPPGVAAAADATPVRSFCGPGFHRGPYHHCVRNGRPMHTRRRNTRQPIRMHGSHVQTATSTFFHTAAALRPHAPTATTLALTDNAFRTGLPSCSDLTLRLCLPRTPSDHIRS